MSFWLVACADNVSQVLSGITFTKLIGICVLAFTHSKLLEVRILPSRA